MKTICFAKKIRFLMLILITATCTQIAASPDVDQKIEIKISKTNFLAPEITSHEIFKIKNNKSKTQGMNITIDKISDPFLFDGSIECVALTACFTARGGNLAVFAIAVLPLSWNVNTVRFIPIKDAQGIEKITIHSDYISVRIKYFLSDDARCCPTGVKEKTFELFNTLSQSITNATFLKLRSINGRYLRNDIISMAWAKTPQEILSLFGRPNNTTNWPESSFWIYNNRSYDNLTKSPDRTFTINFISGRVMYVIFQDEKGYSKQF
jgi:hypothetical protein